MSSVNGAYPARFILLERRGRPHKSVARDGRIGIQLSFAGGTDIGAARGNIPRRLVGTDWLDERVRRMCKKNGACLISVVWGLDSRIAS